MITYLVLIMWQIVDLCHACKSFRCLYWWLEALPECLSNHQNSLWAADEVNICLCFKLWLCLCGSLKQCQSMLWSHLYVEHNSNWGSKLQHWVVMLHKKYTPHSVSSETWHWTKGELTLFSLKYLKLVKSQGVKEQKK